MIDPGKLDRRITLRNPAEAVDGFGEAVRTYSDLADVWAMLEYKGTPKEDTEAGALASVNKVRFTIRHRSDVTAKTQVVYKSETYEVEGISFIGRDRFLTLDTRLKS